MDLQREVERHLADIEKHLQCGIDKNEELLHQRSKHLLIKLLDKNSTFGRPKEIDLGKISELQNKGFTQEEVARKLNISLSSVRRGWLKKDKPKKNNLIEELKEKNLFYQTKKQALKLQIGLKTKQIETELKKLKVGYCLIDDKGDYI